MLTDRATLAKMFDGYHALPSPAGALHAAADAHKLWSAARASGVRAGEAAARADAAATVGERAHACGLYVGAALSMALKPLDVLFGTGANVGGQRASLAGTGVRPYLVAGAEHFAETGLAGLLSGLHAGACLALGAAAGAAVGALGGAAYLAWARDPSQTFGAQLRTCVAAGASDGALVVGAGLALYSGLAVQVFGVGIVRTATAALRGVAVGLGYAAGYAVGSLAGGLVVGLDRPTADRRAPAR